MNIRKLTTIVAAAALVVAPTVANGAAAASVAPAARAGAATENASNLGEATPVLLGLLLVVLIAGAAISGNGKDLPVSP